MATIDADQVELQQAADLLGVHYQTAYRWVRRGRLPARIVDGRYLVARTDIDAVDEQRRTPSGPSKPSRKRLDRQSERIHDALLEGDEATVRTICRRLVDEGTTVVELIEAAVAPSLRRIGQAWHDGTLSIWEEHRATAIVERVLGELAPNPRGRRRGAAMVAAIAGDLHSLPSTMAAVALREAHWHVHHLGADIPGDELVRFCTEFDVDVAVISLTNDEVAARADEVAERIRAGGTPVIVGGAGHSLSELVTRAATPGE